MKCVNILLFNLTGESSDRQNSVIKWRSNVKTTQYETLAMTTATTGKRHLKMNTCVIVTIRDCHILFAFYNVGKISYNWTGRTVELDTENERFTFVCSSCDQYGKCGNFM